MTRDQPQHVLAVLQACVIMHVSLSLAGGDLHLHLQAINAVLFAVLLYFILYSSV